MVRKPCKRNNFFCLRGFFLRKFQLLYRVVFLLPLTTRTGLAMLTKLWISGIIWQLSSVCNFQWLLVAPFEGQSLFPSSIPHGEHPGTKIRAATRPRVPWSLSGLTPQGSSRKQLLVGWARVLPCWLMVPWCFLRCPWLAVFPCIPSWNQPSLAAGFCLSALSLPSSSAVKHQ